MNQQEVFFAATTFSLTGVGLVVGLAMNVKGFRFTKMSGFLLAVCLVGMFVLALLGFNQHQVAISMLGLILGTVIGVVGSLQQRPQRLGQMPIEYPPADMCPRGKRDLHV